MLTMPASIRAQTVDPQNIPVLAMTATLTPDEVKEVERELCIDSEKVRVRKSQCGLKTRHVALLVADPPLYNFPNRLNHTIRLKTPLFLNHRFNSKVPHTLECPKPMLKNSFITV